MFCSASSVSVKLTSAEERVLAKADFKVKDHTFTGRTADISAKATELNQGVEKAKKTWGGLASFITGFHSTGRNSDLAFDLNKVAGRLAERVANKTDNEAPAEAKGFKAAVRGLGWLVGCLSHVAAEKSGLREFRTV